MALDFLHASDYMAIWLSLKTAFYTSIFALPAAIIIGYIMARKQFFGKTIIESILNLPMVMPPVTTGYLLLIILGARSPIGQFIYSNFDLKISLSFPAAVIAATVVSFPLIIRSVKIAMEMIDPKLEEASKTLGASPIKTFLFITLPLAWPGILGGFVLAFARCLGEFGATITFAGNIEGETRTLPLAIYAKMQTPGEESATYTLVAISVFISILAIVGSEYFLKKKKSQSVTVS